MSGETIAAVATATGRAGIAIVRTSGPEALAIGERLAGRKLTAGRFAYADLGVDRCIVLAFAAPRSYTGEDVVEYQCHGGAVSVRRVLERVLGEGARLARRGEFTERAYLNGKLDYEQAESVLALIEARTVRAADDALEGLAGRRRELRRAIYERMLAVSAELEHALDIDEGELMADFGACIAGEVAQIREELRTALDRARRGRILREGALVVLAGPPNAGKSSLMNALLGENRAIVSEVSGTTRDSIEEWLDLDGWPVRLTDTAGLRETADLIEAEGVRRSEALIARADVVVELSETGDWSLAGERVIRVRTKSDLGRGEGLNVSARTGEGLDELRRLLAERVAALAPTDESGDADALAEALGTLTRMPSPEEDLVLAANTMRQASERLGAMIGAAYSADLLDRLFSRFCVGK